MVDWDGVSIPQAVLAGLTFAVVGALLIAAGTSTASFSPYNSDWNGVSALRSTATDTGARVDITHETASYGRVAPNRTVAFVLSPDSVYRPSEVVRVRRFVQRGGTLVVAADFGSSVNKLLRRLGASARIDGRVLNDARSNFHSSAMPVATRVANYSLVDGVESLTLNYGTAVRPRGSTVLVNSSEFAYLDTYQNGQLDMNETLASHPVATVERIGGGRIVVVGDPSVFINSMLDRRGNRQFVRSLLSGRDRLLLDYSHAGRLPPLPFAILVVRESTALQLGIGVPLIALLAVWSRRPDLVPSVPCRWSGDDAPTETVRATRRELVAHLERQNPQWDRERIERIISAVERHQDRGRDRQTGPERRN